MKTIRLHTTRMFSRTFCAAICLCAIWAASSLTAYGKEDAHPYGPSQLVTLDVRNADIRSVLTMLSEQYNLNMVMDDDIVGPISLRLQDVTLHGALEALLTSRGFDYETNNNIVRVAASEVLNTERQIRQERSEFEVLVTEVITLKYLDADDVSRVVMPMLSERGEVSVLSRRSYGGFEFGSQSVGTDSGSGGEGGGNGGGMIRARSSSGDTRPRSRTLLVTDTRSGIERIKTVIRDIDIQPKQILIDARILEVETDTLEDLGLEFDSTGAHSPSRTAAENKLVSAINAGTSAVSFPSETDQGLDLRWSKLVGEDVEIALHALLQDERTRTLSSPRIMVLDGQIAAILIGEQFPIFESTVSDAGTATESLAFYQPIGISLQVIPQITANDNINMVIHPVVSSVGNFVTGSTGLSQPRINVREADTQVSIKNAETIILGGLLQDVEVLREYRVPVLGYLPVIGKVFTRTRTDIDQLNLIVFITPRIVEPYESMKLENAQDVYRRIDDPAAFGTLKERRDNVRYILRDAKDAYRDDNVENAKALFKRALLLDPRNKTAKSYLRKLGVEYAQV